jgi:regulator of protease activity HflC (stomatin/prohibitin superfamily)
MSEEDSRLARWGVLALVGLVVTAIALWLGLSYLGRWNTIQKANNEAHKARIEAANQTQVNELLISANAQQVQIHTQQAAIRLADAVGIREAQDEISKTLTPLYVQFEMVDALKSIAESGKNNTVVYIPTGANGIPLIANASQTQVTAPTP